MHSSIADWVLGLARLISSPTTTLAKMPPGRNSNCRVSWLNTETPVTSEGSRSGVNWIRRTVQSMERASALLSIVLPTPGTSSISRWPPASSTTSADRAISGLPSMTARDVGLDPLRDRAHLVDVGAARRRCPAWPPCLGPSAARTSAHHVSPPRRSTGPPRCGRREPLLRQVKPMPPHGSPARTGRAGLDPVTAHLGRAADPRPGRAGERESG